MLVKLASKLTKMWHTLGPEAKALARTVERPTERFVSGLERGNHALIEEMKRKKPGLRVFQIPHYREGSSSEWEPAIKTITLRVPREPKTLPEVITKRHEIFEAQQETEVKGLGRHLKKFQKRYDSHAAPIDKQIGVISDKSKNIVRHVQANADKIPNAEARLDKVRKYYASKKVTLMQQKQRVVNPSSSFMGHQNPQVLVNESKLVRNTPGAEEFFVPYRSDGESQRLKKLFNFDY